MTDPSGGRFRPQGGARWDIDLRPDIASRPARNAGHKLGAKRPLKPKEVWSIRFWLEQKRRLRDRALFDLGVDSKLRGCDLVKIRIGDVVSGGFVRSRAMVVQQKTGRPVQFELLEPARILEEASAAVDLDADRSAGRVGGR